MKCLIHIGTEKTGTTQLQRWLYENRQALSDNRIYLSEQLGVPNNRVLVAFCQNQLDDWARFNHIASLEEKASHFADFPERFAEEVKTADSDHDLFLISSEHFHSRLRRADEINRLRNLVVPLFDSVQIVSYFREQSAMAKSFYSTALKARSTDDFLDRVRPGNYYYNFLAIADNWASAFGQEQCHFKVYERDQLIAGDIRKDFLATAGLSALEQTLSFAASEPNDSLSHFQAELFKVVNRVVPFWREGRVGTNPQNKRFKAVLAELSCIDQGAIHSPRLAEIPELFGSANREFFDKYIQGQSGFGADSGRAGVSPPALPGFSTDQVATMLGSVLAAVLDEYERAVLSDAQVDKLRGIALGAQAGIALGEDDTLSLLEAALQLCPDDGALQAKLAEVGHKDEGALANNDSVS